MDIIERTCRRHAERAVGIHTSDHHLVIDVRLRQNLYVGAPIVAAQINAALSLKWRRVFGVYDLRCVEKDDLVGLIRRGGGRHNRIKALRF